MSICYDESGGKFTGSISDLDPNACYMTHFKNFLYLRFIEENSDDWRERAQAHKEIQIADRKMEFWKKRLKDYSIIEKGMTEERKRWKK